MFIKLQIAVDEEMFRGKSVLRETKAVNTRNHRIPFTNC